MVEARRPRQQGETVMGFVAAQEAHEVAQPVTHLEAEHFGEEFHRGLVIGRMQDDVADLERHALPPLHRAVIAARDIGGNFEGQPIG